MATPNPFDYFAIQNTISRYCFALDTKDFTLLHDVFTDDVDAIYPFGGGFKGVQVLGNAIENRLKHITSQHAITTQHVEVAEDGKTAKATSYFTGIHFGKGKWKGQQVTAWGKYVDELTCVHEQASVPGSSGKWLISRREVSFMSRLGEEGVMDGES